MTHSREQYLARAQEAEERAADVPDATMKETWLRIARSYRDLAKFARGRIAPTASPDMPRQEALARR